MVLSNRRTGYLMIWQYLQIMLKLFLISAVIATVSCEVVQTTKLFTIQIEPNLFNFTSDVDEFKYTPSLLKSPDLPAWIHYLYSRRDKRGFLYGVVPSHYSDVDIQVVAMNRRSYETKKRVLHLNVQEKANPAKHEVHMKIDNVNVEDLLDPYKMTRLLDVFRDKLWTKSFGDLHVTFLASAVAQGARLPLKPSESEGVVIRLGSTAEFSLKLLDLQEEIKPLWKLQACSRGYKRTSVEKWIRDQGFMLDWCSFRLMTIEPTVEADWLPPVDVESPAWLEMSRSSLPERDFSKELAFSVGVPMLLLALFVIMLSFILCFNQEGMDDESEEFIQDLFIPCEDFMRSKEGEEESEEQLSHYVAVERATSTLRSLSRTRESTPEVNNRLVTASDYTSRPTPPPYMGTLRSNISAI